MSRSASMTTTLDSLRPIAPPALPRNAFFSERALASKIGKLHPRVAGLDVRGHQPIHRMPTGTGRSPGRRRVARRHRAAVRPGRASAPAAARAAICWANSAVWMPWNRPSSQPTSWACAIRSSASDGTPSSVNGSVRRSSSSRSSGARPSSSSRMLVAVDLAQPVAARVVERRRPHLFEQLLDHRADPHHLRRLLDQIGQRLAVGVIPDHRARIAADDLDVVVVGVGCHVPSHRVCSSGVACGHPAPFVDAGLAVVVDLLPRLRPI